MFDISVRPIPTYGSNVWGMSKSGLDALDKVFLHYACCTLGLKATKHLQRYCVLCVREVSSE